MTKTAKEILEGVKERYPVPSANSAWHQLRDDPEFFQVLLESVSSGHSIADFARAVDLPAGRITAWLARMEGPAQRQYEHAREARAMIFADRILGYMEEVKDGTLPPAQAKYLTDSVMWLASRLDPQHWGNKIEVKGEIRSTVEMHLEAVRELAEKIKHGDRTPVIEGEVEPKLIPEVHEPSAIEMELLS